LQAQHCRWDALDIIVFSVVAHPDDSLSINNLKFFISDSINKPYNISYYINGKEISKPLIAFQNRYDLNCNVKKIHDPHDVRSYWFAKNNYVLVAASVNFKKGNLFITIEDVDGESNGGNFEKYTFSPEPNWSFPLCSRYSFWESGSGSGFVEDYRPVKIVLKKNDKD
jgi:hypothetical protein